MSASLRRWRYVHMVCIFVVQFAFKDRYLFVYMNALWVLFCVCASPWNVFPDFARAISSILHKTFSLVFPLSLLLSYQGSAANGFWRQLSWTGHVQWGRWIGALVFDILFPCSPKEPTGDEPQTIGHQFYSKRESSFVLLVLNCKRPSTQRPK